MEDGIIRGVKLLGERSKNGNSYPLATRRAAHVLFEGLHVNTNHRKKGEESGVESRVGKIINVREGNGGTYGDFHFLTKHPMAAAIAEAAERMPDLYGFSIQGKGKVRTTQNGETIVESIDTLRSVDLVADPATNKGLFEATEEPVAKSCEQLVGELIAALVAEGKEDLVKDLIKFKKKLSGGDAPEAPEAPAEEGATEESWKEEYQTLKSEKACRALLENHKVPVEQDLVESLMSMKEDARLKFVKWHKRNAIVKAPRSSEPTKLQESVTKDYASILRSR